MFLNCGKDYDGGVQDESKTFWQIQAAGARADGSILEWMPRQYTLRHVVLNKFLAVAPVAGAKENDANRFSPRLVDSASDAAAAFSLDQVSRFSS